MNDGLARSIGDWNGNSLSPEPCALCPAVPLHCMTVTGGTTEPAPTITHTPHDDTSCNAIQHLDFEPTCSSSTHPERPASWVARFPGRPCTCGPAATLACNPCHDWYVKADYDTWTCLGCGINLPTLVWEPL